MNRCALACVLWLLYSVSSLLLGLFPHQHQHARFGFDADCTACVWRVNITTDAPPEPPAPIVQRIVVMSVLPADSAPVGLEFFHPTASRAPPEKLE